MKKNYIVPTLRSIEVDGKELLMQGSIKKSYYDQATVSMDDNNDPVNNTQFDAKGYNAWDVEW